MTREEVIRQIQTELGQTKVSQMLAAKASNQLLEKQSQGREDGLKYALKLIDTEFEGQKGCKNCSSVIGKADNRWPKYCYNCGRKLR